VRIRLRVLLLGSAGALALCAAGAASALATGPETAGIAKQPSVPDRALSSVGRLTSPVAPAAPALPPPPLPVRPAQRTIPPAMPVPAADPAAALTAPPPGAGLAGGASPNEQANPRSSPPAHLTGTPLPTQADTIGALAAGGLPLDPARKIAPDPPARLWIASPAPLTTPELRAAPTVPPRAAAPRPPGSELAIQPGDLRAPNLQLVTSVVSGALLALLIVLVALELFRSGAFLRRRNE
jgi:hypothetical protein